jgi:hypothetical protein
MKFHIRRKFTSARNKVGKYTNVMLIEACEPCLQVGSVLSSFLSRSVFDTTERIEE